MNYLTFSFPNSIPIPPNSHSLFFKSFLSVSFNEKLIKTHFFYRLISQTYRLINGSFLIGFKLPTLGKTKLLAMQTSKIPLLIAFLLSSLTSISKEEIIKLDVEKGKTYVFEAKSVITEFDLLGNPTIVSKGKSNIQFEIENFDGKTLIYTSKTTSGEYENPDSKIKTIMNLEFPPIVNDVNTSFSPLSVVIQFLSMTGLRCKVDLENNKVELLNLQDTFDEVKKLMEARGFNEDFIAKGIHFVQKDTTWIRKGTLKAHQFIFNFNQSIKTDNQILKSKVDGIKYQLNENNEFVSGKEKGQPGTIFSTVTLSKTHGFSLHYYEAKHDSIDIRYRRTTTGNKITILNETEITFLNEFETGNNLFTFECTIENPKDSSITLFYLDKPYGVEYTRKVLKLDKNNRVKFQTKLQAPSFLFFVNKPLQNTIDFSSTFFYVEPGDTLKLNFTDGTNSPPLVIQGSNATANQAIRDMQKEQLLSFDLINLTPFENENQDIFDRVDDLNLKFENLLKRNNTVLNERTFLFLKNELISIEYYHYFTFLNHYYSAWVRSKAKTAQEIKAEKELVQIAEQKIRDFDIHDHYNDYGIFSRRLSIQYFIYYLNNTGRFWNPQLYNQRRNLQEEFEVGKLILGGSIYYRVLADRITSSVMNITLQSSLTVPATYKLPDATDMMNQLISQSFNKHFSNQLKSFRDTRLNWENENYIPETLFYKPDGSRIKLKEVLKGKPTVLFIASNWGTSRYDFDSEATNNPNIRYVMIVEGDNLAEWQDYIKRAEPVAEQLFLLNNENTLNDIFLSNYTLHIVYNKGGKILGYDVGKTNYTELAKQSLAEKKQLDKSQLINIIAVLGVVLVMLIIGVLIWKWRVRQRFRREQQQRRLRELELTAIRSQMNPHFLFNSLNSVQNLVQQNKGREAHLYLADFAGLIRKVLQNSEKEEVSLAEELEMTEQYLNLEKLRFDFDFSISVEQGIDINNTMVPSMLLQPFAENAVIHGLQNKRENRKLKIEVLKKGGGEGRVGGRDRGQGGGEDKGIVISIEDNGIGREAAAAISKTKNGKGSKLIQERLEILQEKQGEKYRLEITDLTGDETGTRVEIFIPEEN